MLSDSNANAKDVLFLNNDITLAVMGEEGTFNKVPLIGNRRQTFAGLVVTEYNEWGRQLDPFIKEQVLEEVLSLIWCLEGTVTVEFFPRI